MDGTKIIESLPGFSIKLIKSSRYINMKIDLYCLVYWKMKFLKIRWCISNTVFYYKINKSPSTIEMYLTNTTDNFDNSFY